MDVVQLWKDASNDKIAGAVISLFLLVCLILVAVYVVSWFRNLAVGKEADTNPMAEIERLRGEGKISTFEYHRLKQATARSLSTQSFVANNANEEEIRPKKGGSEVLTLKEAELRKAQARQMKSQEGPPASPDFSDSDGAGN